MVKVYKVVELDLYNKLMDIFRQHNNSVTIEELPLHPNSVTQLSETGGDPEESKPSKETSNVERAPSVDYWISFEKAVNDVKLKKRDMVKKRLKKIRKRK